MNKKCILYLLLLVIFIALMGLVEFPSLITNLTICRDVKEAAIPTAPTPIPTQEVVKQKEKVKIKPQEEVKTKEKVTIKTHYVTKKGSFEEQGLASWYGNHHPHQDTASGERYNLYALTAANRTLPLQTYVLVTNLENHKQVVVRINDRGPYVGGRIIDLSYAAAKQVGMLDQGVTRVDIKEVSGPR